jgi:hypothetical protein
VPGAEVSRPKPARRIRCESCLQILSLRHAWDVSACGCGALLLRGRPARPTIHWLGRPGGGWSEIDESLDSETDDELGEEGVTDAPERRLGYYSRPKMAVPVEEIQPPVALTQASLASGT